MSVSKLVGLSTADRNSFLNLSLEKKIELASEIIEEALKRFDHDKIVIAWTGGKDSTLLLWLVRRVCQKLSVPIPICLFIDEGDVFDEIWEFVEKLKQEWQLKLSITHNADVSSQVSKLGEQIEVSKLNQRNRDELKRLDFNEPTFAYEPESYVGNHLMKTVATNQWLEWHKTQALLVGVRWDEQEARAEDDFLRELQNPHHFRVEPILPFKEQDVWDAIHKYEIPYVGLYEQGYRSLGARVTTEKNSDQPAWEQDLANTTERAGRRQDKEKIMQRLRDLGYM